MTFCYYKGGGGDLVLLQGGTGQGAGGGTQTVSSVQSAPIFTVEVNIGSNRQSNMYLACP